MEPNSSLPCLQEAATSPYPGLDAPAHLHLGLLSGLFPSGLPTKILYAFFISPCGYLS
jgi:hypothetical protein